MNKIYSFFFSGTTWTQEMVWLIQNDCDYEGAQCLLCPDRYHFLEIPALMAPHVRDEIRQGNNPVSKRLMFTPIQERAKPWFVKTHLPLHLCPPSLLQKGKVGAWLMYSMYTQYPPTCNKCKVSSRAAESESESAGVGNFDRSRSQSRSR